MKGNKYGLGNKGNLGRKFDDETRKKFGNKGNKNPAWKGGISFEPYGIAWSKQFKKSIRERDNNVCQLCNKHENQFKNKMHVHHIDYIKTNNFTFNLISLCMYCHRITNDNRNHWITFFRNYMKEKYGYNYTYEQKVLVDEVIKSG